MTTPSGMITNVVQSCACLYVCEHVLSLLSQRTAPEAPPRASTKRSHRFKWLRNKAATSGGQISGLQHVKTFVMSSGEVPMASILEALQRQVHRAELRLKGVRLQLSVLDQQLLPSASCFMLSGLQGGAGGGAR